MHRIWGIVLFIHRRQLRKKPEGVWESLTSNEAKRKKPNLPHNQQPDGIQSVCKDS